MKRATFVPMSLIVAFTVAVPVVHAQSTIMKATVPFAFSVGEKLMPAGAYEVREIGARAIQIQSKDGHDNVLGVYNYAGPSKTVAAKLVFDKVGDRYFLTQIWTKTRDEGLQLPTSKLEKEQRASNIGPQSGVETVIVALR